MDEQNIDYGIMEIRHARRISVMRSLFRFFLKGHLDDSIIHRLEAM